VAALSVGAGTLGGALGGHISGRLTWSLAAFVGTLLAGMGCAYYLDRRSRVDIAPDGGPVAGPGGDTVGSAPDPGQLSPAGPGQPIAHGSNPEAAMPAMDSGHTQPTQAWVAAVMAFSDIQKPDFRSLVLTMVGEALGLNAPFAATYSNAASDHVTEIVNSCWGYEDRCGALRALGETMIRLRPHTAAAANMRRLLGGSP
jgi:hypothetical protein